MEGNSNSKPNEQPVANNANDWRSQHEPDLRKNVLINQLKDFALEIEKEAYDIATDKDDYNRKISERILMMKREARNLHSRSSVNETNTLEPEVAAQVLNQGQLVPASVPYTQAPTSQHWLPPGFQSNPNVHASCLPQQQQQPQNTNYMCQYQVIQQRLNETIYNRNFRPPHMQQQTHPTSFPSIQHPFSAVSGRQNPQISALEVCTQLKQKVKELEKDINQLMNALDTQHNHSTSWQNNGEHQGGFRVSSSQQSDTAAASQSLNQRQSLPTSQPWLPQDIQINHNMFQPQKNQPQDETYQRIQVLKEKHLPFLSSYLQKYVDKVQEIDSLPKEKKKEIHKEIQSLRNTKSSLEQATEFLNVDISQVSEVNRENLARVEETLLKMESLKPKQKKQGKIRSSQTHSLQKRRKVDPQVVQSDMFQQRPQMQQPEGNQQLQMPTSHETNEMNDVNMRQGNNIEAGLLQQHLSSSQRQLPTPLASQAQLVDQQILPAVLVNQTGTPTQPGGTPRRSLTTSQTDLESKGDCTESSGSKVNKTHVKNL